MQLITNTNTITSYTTLYIIILPTRFISYILYQFNVYFRNYCPRHILKIAVTITQPNAYMRYYRKIQFSCNKYFVTFERPLYTGCPRRKGPNFGRVFLSSNYTDITQNTYIQSSMVTEILARKKCGCLLCLRTVLCP